MMNALIIIDLLNDFMRPQGALYIGDHVQPLIQFCQELINQKREENYTIIYSCDTHWENDEEFLLFPPHAIRGSWGQKIIEEVKPQEGEFIIPKRRFSAFFGTELDLLLREKKVEKVEIVGVLTNICVLYTAAWAQMLHYQVAAYRQGLTSNDLQAHEFALKEMKNTLGIEIL
jgi:nicotinamidase/pyrazinamidase